jgi:hypothetical protein
MFFACAGTSSAAVIYTANRLPGMSGQDFTTIGEALDYVTRNGYFILEGNDPFEGINADGLALDLDAAKMSSYPQINALWYDLSGNQNSGTLTNGPTWNSSGSFDFDGTDDYVSLPSALDSLNGGTEASLVMVLKLDSNSNSVGQTGIIQLSGHNNSNGNLYFYSNGYTYLNIFRTNRVEQVWLNSTLDATKWHMLTITTTPGTNGWKAYFNGELKDQTTGQSTVSVNSAIQGGLSIGRNSVSRFLQGEINSTQIYSLALTEAQVKQNYFGSPIVTDGLVFAVDANNIVSYPKSGTTTYSLTGSLTGTLTNGVGYLPNNGGTFDFDGTDNYIAISSNVNYTDVTIEAWIYREKGDLLNIVGGTGIAEYFCVYQGKLAYYASQNTGTWTYGTTTIQAQTWYHVAITMNNSNGETKMYVNGILESTTTAQIGYRSGYVTTIGVFGNTSIRFWDGYIPNVRIYNKALTAAEIQQNYQAEQYRFETPAGPVTNGLVVHLDALNLDSYPGTGNTWYDLSGNGNNATRNGAAGNPTWNQTNGWYFYASVNGVNGGLTIANSATIQNLTATTVFLVVAMETKTVISGDTDWMAIYSKFASDQRIAISINQGVSLRYLHIEVPGVTDSATGTFTNADYTGTKYNIMAARVGASGTTGWLNGTQISTSALTTTGNTGAIYLGHDVNNEMFKGSMKASLTYNRALSDAEMTQMFTYLNTKFNVY